MVVIGSIAVGFFLLTFSWTRERITPPKEQKNNLKEDLRNLAKNGPWFILLGAGVATLIFNSVRDGVAMYYFKYYIADDHVRESAIHFSKMTIAYSTFYLFLGQATNMIGVIMAKPISALLSKRRTFMFAMFAAAALSVVFQLTSKGDLLLIYSLQALISFCAGIIFPLLWSMYADAADYSQWTTGRRATGLIFSASSMTQNSADPRRLLTLWLLAIYGFEANAAQSPETLKASIHDGHRTRRRCINFRLIHDFYKLSDQKMTQIIADLESQRAAENS